MKKIIIDIYGADAGPITIIEGAFEAMSRNPELFVTFVGDKELISEELAKKPDLEKRISVIDTDDFINNNEHPSCVLRDRDSASMVMALDYLKADEDCIGLLSAGNTGALLVGSIFRLGLYKGLKTPALSSAIPTLNGKMVCLVDCGANVDCTTKDLCRFALMGEAFIKSMYKLEDVRIGLMSVGREDKKGTAKNLEAFEALSKLPINFVGNIEGSDLLSGYVDVVVADGFVGNILLKSTEEAGKSAICYVDDVIKEFGEEENPAFVKLKEILSQRFELNKRGGATFLGTKKSVIKMHGCAVSDTVCACIDQLLRLSEAGYDSNLSDAISKF